MWFIDIGGDRARQHKSKMCALPDIVLSMLLLDLPLPSTTSSTRSPRSCHLAVAGDRASLPASMTRRPAASAGPVDSAGAPQAAYPTWEQVAAPCQQSYRASARHWPTRAHVAWKTNWFPEQVRPPHPRASEFRSARVLGLGRDQTRQGLLLQRQVTAAPAPLTMGE